VTATPQPSPGARGQNRPRVAAGGRRRVTLEILESRDLLSSGLVATGAPNHGPDVSAVAGPVADVQAAATLATTNPIVDAVPDPITVGGAVTRTSLSNRYTFQGAANAYLLTFTPSDPIGAASWRVSIFDGSGRALQTDELRRGATRLSVEVGSPGGPPLRTFQVSITATLPSSGVTAQESLRYVVNVRPDSGSTNVSPNPASADDSLLTMVPDEVLEQWFTSNGHAQTPPYSHPASPSAALSGSLTAETDDLPRGGSVAPNPGSMSWRPNRKAPPPNPDGDPTRDGSNSQADRAGQAGSDPSAIDPSGMALFTVDPARGLIDAPGGPAVPAPAGPAPAGDGMIQLAAWRQGIEAGVEEGLPEDPNLPSGRNLQRQMRAASDRSRLPVNRTAVLVSSAVLIVPNLAVLAWSRRHEPFRFGRRSRRVTRLKPEPD